MIRRTIRFFARRARCPRAWPWLLLPNRRGAFAGNRLDLIEPLPRKPPLQRLSDLAQPEVQRVALGQVAVEPSGRYARLAIDGQRLWPLVQRKVVLASDVREVLRPQDAGCCFGRILDAFDGRPIP